MTATTTCPKNNDHHRAMNLVVLLLLQLFPCARSALHADEWMQVSSNVAFLRRNQAENKDQNNMKMEGAMEEAMHRMLAANPAYAASYQRTGEEWSSYQLAWRLLGFYVDCNPSSNNNNNGNNNKDGKDGGGNQNCQRMVMYAVYVDLDYEGGGFDEYEYYDQGSGKYVCYSENNNKGCREKMDCHSSDTNWRMLGVFKISSISQGDGWMEQLFKHEGVCVWGEDTYKFASQMREKLPNACKETKVQDSSGNPVYYDVKPDKNATITVGLYSDERCSVAYQGADLNVFDITGLSEENFNQFNQDLDTWRICQPCIAYSVSNAGSDYYCYDEAGYENCNQCMKFSAKSGCEIASMRDIALADRQQTLIQFPMYGTMIGGASTARVSASAASIATAAAVTQGGVPFLKFCSLFFGVCLLMFVASSLRCKVVKRRQKKAKKESLIEEGGADDDGLMKQKTSKSKKPKSPKEGRKSSRKGAAKTSSSAKKDKTAAASKTSSKEVESADITGETPFMQLDDAKVGALDSLPKSRSTKGELASEPIETSTVTEDRMRDAGEDKKDDVPVDVESREMPEDSATPGNAVDMTSILAAISKSMSFGVGKDELNDKKEPMLDVEDRLQLESNNAEKRAGGTETKPSSSTGWMKSRVFKLFKTKKNQVVAIS